VRLFVLLSALHFAFANFFVGIFLTYFGENKCQKLKLIAVPQNASSVQATAVLSVVIHTVVIF
jgi:hypothetical protein